MGHYQPIRRDDAAALDAKVRVLNARLSTAAASDILRAGLDEAGSIALVSSFGAESVVLLHMLSEIDRTTPVIFLDTKMLFPETLAYQRQVSEALGLSNIQIVRSMSIETDDPDGTLHQRDPDTCCALRKAQPLENALAPFDAWITGRKRFQSGSRAALNHFEAELPAGRIKVNPLAAWSPSDVQDYMTRYALPRHPLISLGYSSIGCAPCTSPVAEGEDARAGRWRGSSKDECGIHFSGGRVVRPGVSA